MAHLVEEGGTWLNSFDGNYEFYRKCGFEPVSACKFNEEFAPPGWLKGRDDSEDVIFFKYTGKKSKYIDRAEFYNENPDMIFEGETSYDDAKKALFKNMNKEYKE